MRQQAHTRTGTQGKHARSTTMKRHSHCAHTYTRTRARAQACVVLHQVDGLEKERARLACLVARARQIAPDVITRIVDAHEGEHSLVLGQAVLLGWQLVARKQVGLRGWPCWCSCSRLVASARQVVPAGAASVWGSGVHACREHRCS